MQIRMIQDIYLYYNEKNDYQFKKEELCIREGEGNNIVNNNKER